MTTQLASSPLAYRQNAVLAASPSKLVVMLYDGARRFLYQAAVAMREEQIATSHYKLRRAEDIIIHLRETLDMEQGEIAEQLSGIYRFCQRHLLKARAERDPQKIEEVSALLGELRDAWSRIEQT
jgi:flagellar protein FliS